MTGAWGRTDDSDDKQKAADKRSKIPQIGSFPILGLRTATNLAKE